jgi:two-component system, NarL family, response regulator NreC
MSGAAATSGPPAGGTWVLAGSVPSPLGTTAKAARAGVGVLLVDDHPIVRAGVRFMLESEDRFTVLGEATTGREAIRLAIELRPDVVVMDVSLPELGGLEATRAIKEHDPSIRVLIVTMHSEEEYVLGMLDAGADGYLLKQGPSEELKNGILRVFAGERVLHQAALQALVARAVRPLAPPVEALSGREHEILVLLADGATSKEIAVVLGLAPKTVENHRARILDKLGVVNSAAAVRAAVARGLIPNGANR